MHELLGDKVIDPIAGTLRANKATSRQRGRGGELQQTTAVTGGPVAARGVAPGPGLWR